MTTVLEPPVDSSTELDREKAYFSSLVAGADVGFVVIDSERRVVWANRIFEERFAHAATEAGQVLGLTCNRALCGKKDRCEGCPSAAALETGSVVHHELRVWIHDRYYYVYATGIPIRSDTEPRRTLVMLQDVSNLEILRRSEEAFAASEQRFRSLFEGVPAAMATVKMDGTFLQVNQTLCTMLGYKNADLLQKTFAEIMHPDDLARGGGRLGDLGGQNRRTIEAERRFIRRDGSTVWGQMASVVQLDTDGMPAYTLALIQDITRRKQLEQEVEATRRRYETLVDSIDGIVWEADAETMRFSFVSEQAERLLGFPVEKWLSQPRFWRNQIHPEDVDRMVEAFSRQAAQRETFELKYRMVAADGNPVQMQDRVTVVSEPGSPTKLCGIMTVANTRTIDEGAPAERPPQPRRSPKRVDLNTLVADMGLALRRTIDEEIGLSTNLEAAPGLVAADAGQIQRILLNLAVNAREAMPDGGRMMIRTSNVEIDSVRAAVEGVEPGKYTSLSVSDSGCGMDEQTRARMFEPFFTTKEGASGLGLSTVHGIVKKSGGHVVIESEVGQGTEVRIYLPHVDADETPDCG